MSLPVDSERLARPSRLWRLLPLVVLLLAGAAVFATGLHRELSLEALVRHRGAIAALIAEHRVAAVAAFVTLYVVVVALSIPGAATLTIAGGFVFGTWTGGIAALVGATVGATIIFVVARSAAGEWLLRRAGPRAEKLAAGFRKDAFCYLLCLRLVPLFPFWLVNLVPAVAGVRLAPFVAATALGIVPATFAFALFGEGLDSVIAAQAAAFEDCVTAGRSGCRLDFDPAAAATPRLIAALAALGTIALIPVAVRRWRARHPLAE